MNNTSASQSLRTPARTELVRTSLLNAQHWLDHGTEMLAQGTLGDWQTVVNTVERHLIEVVASLKDRRMRSLGVAAQLDATTRATNHFWYGVLAWCGRRKLRADRGLERSMDRIYEKIDTARSLLDLAPQLGDTVHEAAIGADDVYEAMALEPALDLVRIEAERAVVQLGGKDAPRIEIIECAAEALERYVDHAVFLIALHDDNDAKFTDRVNAASDAVTALIRGIGGRYRTLEVRQSYERIEAGIAMLRAAVTQGYGAMAKVVAYHHEAA